MAEQPLALARYNYSVTNASASTLNMAAVVVPFLIAIGFASAGSLLATIIVVYYLGAWFSAALCGRPYLELTESGIRVRAAYYRYSIPYSDVTIAGECDGGGSRFWSLIGFLSGRGSISVTTCVHFRTKRVFPVPLVIPPLLIPFLVRCLSFPLSLDDAMAFAAEVNRRRLASRATPAA